jgi:hypothetical protein
MEWRIRWRAAQRQNILKQKKRALVNGPVWIVVRRQTAKTRVT